jgi:hypothetical protein
LKITSVISSIFIQRGDGMAVRANALGSYEPPVSPGFVWFRRIVVGLLIAAPVLFAGYVVKDRFDRAAAKPGLRAEWTLLNRALVIRLRQRTPLELGQVWATHGRQICGLVNGKGSFGGKTGMVRFYGVAGAPVFQREIGDVAFAKAFQPCLDDPWVVLRAGSQETGYCATREGARSCRTVAF